jgi:2-dehydro-3-deoxyphosphogluconate aldolase/(4S)-4-hydroxy-2-oxoglutarate aldolase
MTQNYSRPILISDYLGWRGGRDVTRCPRPGEKLLDSRIVAIFRAPDARRVQAAAEVLVARGVRYLEISLTTPGAPGTIAALRATFGGAASIGAGTVIGSANLAAVLDAGAEFVVTPVVEAHVIESCAAAAIPCYPGALTATEILTAWQAGASAVKVFPAGSLGPGYIKGLRDPLPDIPLVPTGGIAIDAIPAYLQAGSLAVGLGGPLLGDALRGGDLAGLGDRAERAVAAVKACRDHHDG